MVLSRAYPKAREEWSMQMAQAKSRQFEGIQGGYERRNSKRLRMSGYLITSVTVTEGYPTMYLIVIDLRLISFYCCSS